MDGIDGSKTTAEDASIPGPTVRVLNPPHNTPKPREDSSDRPTARGSAVRKLLVPTPSPITGRGRLYQATMTPPRIFVFFCPFFSAHTLSPCLQPLPLMPLSDASRRSPVADRTRTRINRHFPSPTELVGCDAKELVEPLLRRQTALQELPKRSKNPVSSLLCYALGAPRPAPTRSAEKRNSQTLWFNLPAPNAGAML